tara:strand:- start:5993 stop:6523 length:531 start_codon:yes stop_codon:yes gene_type:complete
MACDLTLGRLFPCTDQTGGIKSIAFVNYTSGLLNTATFATTEQITAFGSALTMFKYEVRSAGHSFVETGSDPDTEGVMVTQVLTAVLEAPTLADRKELKLLRYGRPQIFVETYNGIYLLAGIENGCTVQITKNSGADLGEKPSYTLVATAKEKAEAHFVVDTIIGDTTNTVVTVGT